MHYLITGGSGYIGERLIDRLIEQGHWVTALGRRKVRNTTYRVRNIDWSLGQGLPDAACAGGDGFPGVDCVFHLAHFWDSEGDEASDINITGTRALLDSARDRGIPRVVFCSSIAARPDALNRYGRIKFATESLFDRPSEIAARVGLVYGGPEKALWGTMCRVASLSPLLPMIEVGRPVQPIHINEVCDGLLRISENTGTDRKFYFLAGPNTLSFGAFLKAIAARKFGRKLVLLPIPLWFALAAVATLRMIPGLPNVDRERVLGLAGTITVESAADLAELGLSVTDPIDGLGREADAS